MKKYTIMFLFALSLTCAFAAVGCGDDGENNGGNNPPAKGEVRTVTIEAGEGYSIVGDGVSYDEENGCWVAQAEENTSFSFSLDVGAFYTGIPTVTVGNVALSDLDGTYSVTVKGDTEIAIDGIFKDVSSMVGSGAFDDAFVITRPIDLIYIAEQVNAGNETYSKAAYVLAADLDFKGEEIEIIGNSEENFFSGCFTCLTNSETGEMERFAISNFKINSTDSNYVGLFGCVQADMTVTSSGLFYGIRLDNFQINASAANLTKGDRSIYCGGLMGYGLGVRSYLCDATNGEINVSSDASEFSFVGGMSGVQQGYFMQEYNQYFAAETAYATVDVDVNVVQGTALYAGGISGYLYTNSFITPSFIHNSYSTGNVSGAIRTGGLVGGLGQYSSVATSYSSGNVMARVKLTSQTDGFLPEYCIAYAGGIAGFAENDTVVNDCFAVGTITASAVDGDSAEKVHHAIGGGDEDGKVNVASRKYSVRECPETIDTNALLKTLTEELGWQTYNWIITDTSYPTINYEASSESVTTTIVVKYVDKNGNPVKVGKAESESYSYTDAYAPIADAFVNNFLQLYLTADDGKQLSFGYYFDKECTDPVPYSYLTTRSAEIYVGFADPAPIVGEYLLAVKNDSPVKITVKDDGTIVCADGTKTTEAYYQYDGENLIIEGARLARYFTGEVDTELSMNEDAIFDMNRYMSYYFEAQQTASGLQLYDGVYFTKAAPLLAYAPTDFAPGAYYVQKTDYIDEYVFLPDGTGTKNGRAIEYAYADGVITIDGGTEIAESELLSYNPLKGTWQKSANVHKFFTFNGVDVWSAYTNVYTRDMISGSVTATQNNAVRGTYAVGEDGKTYTLLNTNGDEYATVTFDEYGFLSVSYANGTKESYGADIGYLGVWKGSGVTLRFDGVNSLGEGTATIYYENWDISYNLTYSRSETNSPATYMCLYYEDTVFGYFTHNLLRNTLSATLYDPDNADSGYSPFTLSLVNVFDSVWISDDEVFDNIDFNGIGSFNENGDWTGYVTIGQERVAYVLKNGGLSGYFDYNGQRYTIVYDDLLGTVSVNLNTVLQRKDELADIDFVSINENGEITSFSFDGKGNLEYGGRVSIKDNQFYGIYNYQVSNDPAYDFIITLGNQTLGTIVKNETNACYDVTFQNVDYALYIRNEFTGEWAIGGEFADNVFSIGATDLNGNITATFHGIPVRIFKLSTDYYTFSCEMDGMPVTYYMYGLYDNETGAFDSFAISQYDSLVYGDYVFCSRTDGVKGTWTQNTNGDFTISFDGVQSSYSNGTAMLSYKGYATPYFYRVYTNQKGGVESVMLWSQTTYNGETLYYKLEPTSNSTAGAFVNADGKAFLRTKVDSLYKIQATDKDGYTYTFNGGNLNNDTWGTIIVEKEGEATRALSYDIVSFNDNSTATLTIRETVNGETITYTATLNYKDNSHITIELVKQEA